MPTTPTCDESRYGTIFTTNLLILEAYAEGTGWAVADSGWDLGSLGAIMSKLS